MDKNPKKVEAGKKAAAARWGDPRVVRLDELTPAQRRLVVALVDAAKEANVPKLSDYPPDEQEAIKAAIAAKRAARTAAIGEAVRTGVAEGMADAIRRKEKA